MARTIRRGVTGLFIGHFPTKQEAWRSEACSQGLISLPFSYAEFLGALLRASYLRGPKYTSELLVVAIRDQRLTVGDFPGFNAVLLSYTILRTVVRESNPSWLAALANVAGVYVITDNTTGKQYVGSAYGGVGLWQRWCAYAKTGHGGNKELRQLLDANGVDHAHHLQFSILEVCDLNASDEYIIGRESHWKTVLRTREFGLNSN